MKKIICCLLMALLILPSFSPLVLAEESGDEDETGQLISGQLQSSGANDLLGKTPEESQKILEQLRIDDLDTETILQLKPSDFLQVLWNTVTDVASSPLKILCIIMAVVMLCALINAMKLSFAEKTLGTVFNTVCVLCVAVAVIVPVVDCINRSAQTIKNCAEFIMSFIPVLAGIMTVSGQPVSASTYNIFLFSTSQVVADIAATTIVPLLCIFLAFCIVGALNSNLNINSVAKTIKTISCWVLGFMLTVLVGILTLQGLVSSGADNVAMKAAKFAMSSFIPVVGGALSDALASVQGCLKLVKTTVGTFGILVAVCTFLPILLECLMWILVLSIGATVAEILDIGEITKILRAVVSVLGILIAVILCFALLLIITTAIMLMIGMGS